MKLKKAEIIVIAITAAVVFFTGGFFTGRATGKTALTIQATGTETRAEIPVAVPQAPDPAGSVLTNINTATADQLSDLDGIGPVLAERIVEYREKNGPFESIDQIMDVEGVGGGKYEAIKDYISVS